MVNDAVWVVSILMSSGGLAVIEIIAESHGSNMLIVNVMLYDTPLYAVVETVTVYMPISTI